MNKVNEDITDFIGVYENAITRQQCEEIMQYVDRLLDREAIDRRQQFPTKHQGDDVSVGIDTTMIAQAEGHFFVPAVEALDAAITQCTQSYLDSFPVFENTIKNYHMKFQRTEPSQGYHVWHNENSHPIYKGRDLVWTCFLNDVVDGGETEFLYQRRRVPAVQGSILLFPAAFTHTHRGNPPLSGTKYIATGWWVTCESD